MWKLMKGTQHVYVEIAKANLTDEKVQERVKLDLAKIMKLQHFWQIHFRIV